MTEPPTETLHKVELRELDSLLRKKLGNDAKVLEYSAESFLPLGENYGSTILKVHAKIGRTRANNTEVTEDKDVVKSEKLDLVAKMLPATDFQRSIFDSPYTFRKEAFFYEELIPAYRQLERELGVPEDELFDVLPELYGVRFSLQEDADSFDDDAVILMQNLKVLGFYTVDRRKGLDLEHARHAIIALARFHGLGMAMKHHKPDFYFGVLKTRSKCLEFSGDGFDDSQRFFQRVMLEDPVMSKHYERLVEAMNQPTATTWASMPPEPWSTIVHSDFWINNILFRKDEMTGRVRDIKFVDFQNFLFLSPLRELTFFVMTNFDAEVMEHKFDELIDCYYETFMRVLERMGCDTEPFSRDKFDARLRIDAFEEFPHCPFMIKVMTDPTQDKVAETDEVMKRMLDQTVHPLFLERLRRCVNKYAEKGWLRHECEK